MKRIRNFSQKHSIVFAFLISIITLLVWSIDFDKNPIGGFDMLIGHVIVSVLAFIFLKKLALKRNAYFVKESFGKGFFMGTPFLIIGLVSALYSNSGVELSSLSFLGIPNLLLFTANMFMVGFGEEIIYRGIVLNNMVSQWGDTRKGMIKAIVLSAVVFGLAHLGNMLVMPPLTVLVQAINAASAAVLFGAIYIRSKNIWSVMIVHFLVDWISLFLQQCFTGATSIIATEFSLLQAVFIVFAGSLPPLIIATILLRKSKLQTCS